jgi:hypothetical protein
MIKALRLNLASAFHLLRELRRRPFIFPSASFNIVLKIIVIQRKIDNGVLPKNRHHPVLAFFLDPGAIAGKLIVLHFSAITMLNAVMMQIIEMRPKISFRADAPIPIVLPDLSTTAILDGIYLIRITTMNFPKYFR